MPAFGIRVVPVILWSLILFVLAAMPRTRSKAVDYFDEISSSRYAAQPELECVLDPTAAEGPSLGRGVPFSVLLVSYGGPSLLHAVCRQQAAREVDVSYGTPCSPKLFTFEFSLYENHVFTFFTIASHSGRPGRWWLTVGS